MLICDTHADTLFRLAMEKGKNCDITMERLKQGGVSMQTLAMFVGGSSKLPDEKACYEKMYAELKTLKDSGWKQITSPAQAVEGETAFLLSVEGCDLMQEGMDVLDMWYDMGVRMCALTWNYDNCIGTPACKDKTTPLKAFGREAVKKMQEKKIAVDVSHLNQQGFFDLLDMGVTPLASHSCCYALCEHPRNLTDGQLKALFAAGGYVGVNFYPRFLKKEGQVTLDTVCDHIQHMMALGGEGKVGLGSDFDGIDTKPEGLDNPSDLPALFDALRRHGLPEDTVRGIAGENLLHYFERL